MPNFNVLTGILWSSKKESSLTKSVKQQKLKQKKLMIEDDYESQPIKLQIELPLRYKREKKKLKDNDFTLNFDLNNHYFNDGQDDEDDYKQKNVHINNNNNNTKQRNLNRISLHISFDSGFGSRVKYNNDEQINSIEHASNFTSSIGKAQSHAGSSTSGYSSSSSNEFKESFALSDRNTKTPQHDEHIYDRLNYATCTKLIPSSTTISTTTTPPTTTKRRHSISSSNSSLSSTSISSSALTSSYFTVSPLIVEDHPTSSVIANSESIYEEICNFQQITSTPTKINNAPSVPHNNNNNNNDHGNSYLYETLYNCKSSSIKRIRKLNSNTSNINTINSNICSSTILERRYQREYSVNEIFQNLELFKKQAKEEENLLKTKLTPQQQQQQHSSLTTATPSMITAKLSKKMSQLPPLPVSCTKKIKNHNYINEKLTK